MTALQIVNQKLVNWLRLFRVLLQGKHGEELFEVGVSLLSLGIAVEVENLGKGSEGVVGEGSLVVVLSGIRLGNDESASLEGLVHLGELTRLHELRAKAQTEDAGLHYQSVFLELLHHLHEFSLALTHNGRLYLGNSMLDAVAHEAD